MNRCIFIETNNSNIKVCKDCGKTTTNKNPPHLIHRICKAKASQGLGDTAAKFIDTVTLGQGHKIAKIGAEWLGLEDCNCNKRQDFLNDLIPYGSGNNPNGV